MARKCKCPITKEYGTTDTFFKVNTNGKNKYYKSKEIYYRHLREERGRKKLIDFIVFEILNYKRKQKIPSLLFKRIKELNKKYNYKVIYETFVQNKKNISYWLNLENKFKDETGKINYMMAIITNNIEKINQLWLKRQKEQAKNQIKVDTSTINETTVVKKEINRGISDFLDD